MNILRKGMRLSTLIIYFLISPLSIKNSPFYLGPEDVNFDELVGETSKIAIGGASATGSALGEAADGTTNVAGSVLGGSKKLVGGSANPFGSTMGGTGDLRKR